MSEPLNTAPREGWRNRHTDPMPSEACNMMIQYGEAGGKEGELVGRWFPNEDNTKTNLIGTFRCIGHFYPYSSFGIHTWRNNDSEFTYYKIL